MERMRLQEARFWPVGVMQETNSNSSCDLCGANASARGWQRVTLEDEIFPSVAPDDCFLCTTCLALYESDLLLEESSLEESLMTLQRETKPLSLTPLGKDLLHQEITALYARHRPEPRAWIEKVALTRS